MDDPKRECDRVFGQRLLVAKGDVGTTRLDGCEPGELAEGRARFRVERLALTANTVTYALLGDGMGYWRFFPAPEGYGIVPAWGLGVCTASQAEGVAEGDRFYGYWPLAEQLEVELGKVKPSGFVDPSPHRQGLADLYNRYERRGAPDAAADSIEALFRPLFFTGWMVSASVAAAEDHGAERLLVTSASSKTAMGLAFAHARRAEPRPRLVGLTSRGNVDFVTGLGFYDEVLAYADADALPVAPTVLVDFAGDADLRKRVIAKHGDALRASIAVGVSHGSAEALASLGPETTFFFAPEAMKVLQEQLGGRAGFARAAGEIWAAFAARAGQLVQIEERSGMTAAKEAFDALVRGEVSGAKALVIAL